MPFSAQTKAEMFIHCGRLCCLCLKQCGTKIEAAHIIDEAAGGSNDADNGIPLCFDCHQEIRAYNPKHPKGNKFSPRELRAHRNRVYTLVESGVIYAQIVAAQVRAVIPKGKLASLGEVPDSSPPSAEAKHFLDLLLQPAGPPDAATRKLRLLSARDRAFVVDALVERSAREAAALIALARSIGAKATAPEESRLVIERVVRSVTLFGDVGVKTALLREVPEEVLATVDKPIRMALFEDLISIVNRNQYSEVNDLVPVLVQHHKSVPRRLYKDYVKTLLDHTFSGSWYGAPAARRGVMALPDKMAREGLSAIDAEYLCWIRAKDSLKNFIGRYKHLETDSKRSVMFDDFVNLSYKAFVQKYGKW